MIENDIAILNKMRKFAFTMNNDSPYAADIEKRIFEVTPGEFENLALEIFAIQHKYNLLYRKYCDAININKAEVVSLQTIPFLPISFFKSHVVSTGNFKPEIIFESSGTTAAINSKHLVKKISIYKKSFNKAFGLKYGDARDLCIIGLLPSYLERQHSSLVYMVGKLISISNRQESGFYLDDFAKLHETLLKNEQFKQQTILFGVTYALLDFADQYPMALQYCRIIETGGMKGRRKEITREEVHSGLTQRLGLAAIHTEYGMTELLSQAYAAGNGMLSCPPWMKILLRAADDPFEIFTAARLESGSATGVINVIDLANIYSCPFIATDDIGKLYPDGSFEVRGRLDNSDIRGCSLMIT